MKDIFKATDAIRDLEDKLYGIARPVESYADRLATASQQFQTSLDSLYRISRNNGLEDSLRSERLIGREIQRYIGASFSDLNSVGNLGRAVSDFQAHYASMIAPMETRPTWAAEGLIGRALADFAPLGQAAILATSIFDKSYIFKSDNLGFSPPVRSNNLSILLGLDPDTDDNIDEVETEHVAGREASQASLSDLPPVSLSMLIKPDERLIVAGEKTAEGVLVRSTSLLWAEIATILANDFSAAHEIGWELWEEMIAGCFAQQGYDEVILTPKSGDHGRDVIAIKRGFGSVRILGSVKAYHPGTTIGRDMVHELIGVLGTDRNASKGILATTAKFAPNLLKTPGIAEMMPHRLELLDGEALQEWLRELVSKDR